MGIPIDAMPATGPSTSDTTLPTPVQTPPSQTKGLPTPIADSCGDIFDLSKQLTEEAPPAYTQVELERALDNPPVQTMIWYGTHVLHGTLYYMPSLFSQLYGRFLDISPSDRPQLADLYCKPWVLFNKIQGSTWVNEEVLRLDGCNTAQLHSQEPRFVAITDRFSVLCHVSSLEIKLLGNISVHGSFDINFKGVSNDIIVALPSSQPLLGYRQAPMVFPGKLMARPIEPPTAGLPVFPIKELTPAPTTSIVLGAVHKIVGAAEHDENMTGSAPKKSWLIKNLPDHFGDKSPLSKLASSTQLPLRSASSSQSTPSSTHPSPVSMPQQSARAQRMSLSPYSALWAHRGNEALFKRGVWQQMCYSSGQTDANVETRGGTMIPDAYAQVLFEDLQGRERVVGTERLADVAEKWYRFGEGESLVWEGVEKVGGKGKGEKVFSTGIKVEVVRSDEKMDVD